MASESKRPRPADLKSGMGSQVALFKAHFECEHTGRANTRRCCRRAPGRFVHERIRADPFGIAVSRFLCGSAIARTHIGAVPVAVSGRPVRLLLSASRADDWNQVPKPAQVSPHGRARIAGRLARAHAIQGLSDGVDDEGALR